MAQLLRHEHASLALAQRCSAVAAPTPLFSALLNYRHRVGSAEARSEAVRAWEGIEYLGAEERTNYPFTLSVDDLGEGFVLTAQVRLPIDPKRICGFMHTALEQLANALENAPTTPLWRLDVLPPAERHQLLTEWNATEVAYPQDRCIHELFEAQTAKAPEAVAVVHGERQLSYGELNARANRLAHYLRALGVTPETRVAICVERSLEMVVGLLAILKAGGAYVPLDPAYPAERLAYMLADSAPVVILTDAQAQNRLPAAFAGAAAIPVLDLEADAERWAGQPMINPDRASVGLTARHLAYVIYTSGSTGIPKGVMVEHRSLANLIGWHCDAFDLTERNCSSSVSGLGFDAATWEVWPPLCVGGGTFITLTRNCARPASRPQLVAKASVRRQLFADANSGTCFHERHYKSSSAHLTHWGRSSAPSPITPAQFLSDQ